MDGKTIVARWRRDYGTMAGLENDIDAAIAQARAEERANIKEKLCEHCRKVLEQGTKN